MKKLLIHSYIIYLFSLFIVLVLVFFHFKGIVYYDEGYVLNSALKIAHGQIPYRDFDLDYTPLSFFTTALSFHLFGESVLSERIAAFIVSLLSAFALYKLIMLTTANKTYAFLAIVYFLAWGPTHINFLSPTMLALSCTTYTVFFYQKAILSQRGEAAQDKLNGKRWIYFFWTGVMVVLTFFAKQNFGVGMMVLFLLSTAFLKKSKLYSFKYYVLGLLLASIIAVTLLLTTNSFFSFLQNMYIHTFLEIIARQTLSTPFLYEGSIFIRIIKLYLYLSPLIFAGIVLFLAIKKRQQSLIIVPLAVALFYLLGIRPTTDYDHLVPLLAFSSITFPFMLFTIKNQIIRKGIYIVFFGMILLGFYSAYFNGYYKWDSPLKDDTVFAADPRLHIFLTAETLESSEMLKQYIDAHSKPNEAIFINYYAPFIYFLADRPNASRYDYIAPNAIPLTYQQNTVETLQKKHVKLILTHGENEQSLIANYIRKNYHLTKKISDYDMYIKNSSTP